MCRSNVRVKTETYMMIECDDFIVTVDYKAIIMASYSSRYAKENPKIGHYVDSLGHIHEVWYNSVYGQNLADDVIHFLS